MGEGDRPGGGPEATRRRLTVVEAAEVLGITAEAVRSRIKRRTLDTIREGRTAYVVLSEATAGEATDRAQPVGDRARPGVDAPIDRTDALIDALSGQVEDLREQLHSERQAHAEARRLLAAALERIPAIEAPPEARESPETAEEQQGRPQAPLRCPRHSGGRTEALVEEDVRQLMDVTGDTLITVVVTLVVGGPLAYVIGLAQSRRQRLEDRRAEVIAELFRHLYIVQDAFYKWSHLEDEGATSRIVIADRHAKRGVAAFETLSDLKLYYYSNEPWLYQSTSATVEDFIKLAESIANSHPPDLKDIDFFKTDEGHRASIRMSVAIPQLMSSLIEEFREIINPPPRYVRALEWLETRGKRDDAQQ